MRRKLKASNSFSSLILFTQTIRAFMQGTTLLLARRVLDLEYIGFVVRLFLTLYLKD